jgi:hypothetical protein
LRFQLFLGGNRLDAGKQGLLAGIGLFGVRPARFGKNGLGLDNGLVAGRLRRVAGAP